MNKLARTGLLTALVASGLALSGCESKAQKEVDHQAEAIADSANADAALLDSLAPTATNGAELQREADKLRAQGANTEERLKSMADELDDVPAKPKN